MKNGKKKDFMRQVKFFGKKEGEKMTNEDRQLIVETLGEMRELKGQMREFKEHVIGRVEKLEKKEAERSKEQLGIFSVVIAFLALVINFIFNVFRHSGK